MRMRIHIAQRQRQISGRNFSPCKKTSRIVLSAPFFGEVQKGTDTFYFSDGIVNWNCRPEMCAPSSLSLSLTHPLEALWVRELTRVEREEERGVRARGGDANYTVRVVPSSVTRECNALSPFERGVKERRRN